MSHTVDMREAGTRLRDLLTLARAGAEIIITDGDEPVARLLPFGEPKEKRVAGLNRGQVRATGDFDEALPDEFWAGEP